VAAPVAGVLRLLVLVVVEAVGVSQVSGVRYLALKSLNFCYVIATASNAAYIWDTYYARLCLLNVPPSFLNSHY